MAHDNKLDEDAVLDKDEEQFFKRLRKLAISPSGYYAKDVFVETSNETAPHAGGNIT